MEKFESKVQSGKNPDEKNREIILRNSERIFTGAVQEILRKNPNLLMEKLTVDNIMESIFPTNESFRQDKELISAAEKYLYLEKEKGMNKGARLEVTPELKRGAWGAAKKHPENADD